MKKHIRKKRIAAAVLVLAMSAGTCLTAWAESPQFAYDEETWEKLRDNTMEYDELEMLVEEYNTTYLNNQSDYAEDRDGKNNEELRQEQYEDAEDLLEEADDLSSSAEDLRDTLEELSDAALAGVSVNASGLSSAYASLSSSSALLRQNALTTKQSADASYEDQTTKNYSHQNTQLGIKAQTKSEFAAYNLAKKSIPLLEEEVTLAQETLESTQREANAGTATATDVLNAQEQLESLQSSLTSTKANVEKLRQTLCIDTGWSYNDNPDIQEVPAADTSKIDAMDLEADTQTALDNNLTLKYDKALLANMDKDSTDYTTMSRTIQNQEQTIKSTMQDLYNSCKTYQTSLASAKAANEAENRKMETMETKKSLGMVTDLEYETEKVQQLSSELSVATADINLQQAIENYNWALRGYISSSSESSS